MKLVSKSGRDNGRGSASVRSSSSGRREVAYNREMNIRNADPAASTRSAVPNHGEGVNRTASAVKTNGYGSVNDYDRRIAPGRKSPVKAILITLMVLVIICGGLFVGLCFYVDSLDTVFPNVWADGIKVSGLTFEEAKQAILNEGYESNADGISATIVFPDGSRFTVTGEQAGLSYDAEEAAVAAYRFGRDESFFGSAVTYIKAILDRTDLTDLSSPTFDDSVVRQFAAEYTAQFNETLFDSDLEHNDSFISVTRGTGLHPALENDVYKVAVETLTRAADEHENLTTNYTPETNMADTIDAQIRELQMLFDYIHEEPVSSQLLFGEAEDDPDNADDSNAIGDEDDANFINDINLDENNIIITPSSTGKTFDLDSAKEQLRNAEYGATIVIPLIILEPEFSHDEMKDMLFRDVLAEVKTNISGTSNRVSNINVASKHIDGTILNPGVEFSFNKIVGRRTRDRGFLEAPIILGGRLQPGIGGGICQVSSTIYAALLNAAPFGTDIEITERRPHGLTISYLPLGFDSTVVYGNTDFRFRNKMEFPIKLETVVSGREMIVRIIGTNVDGSRIEVESSEPVIIPFSTQNTPTDELYIGDTAVFTGGQNGARVDIFQNHFSADGELIERIAVGTSRYNHQNRIILVGTAERPPPPVVDNWDHNNQHDNHNQHETEQHDE